MIPNEAPGRAALRRPGESCYQGWLDVRSYDSDSRPKSDFEEWAWRRHKGFGMGSLLD
jgi:hypothetical protein